jgi:hypothetical protein
MKPSVLKLWVRALRSGKYKQARNRLPLCNLYIKQTGKGRWDKTTTNGYYQFLDELGHAESSTLPNTVVRWAGLKNPQVELSNPNDDSRLIQATTLNDGDPARGIKRHNFKQIADALLKAAKARTLR